MLSRFADSLRPHCGADQFSFYKLKSGPFDRCHQIPRQSSYHMSFDRTPLIQRIDERSTQCSWFDAHIVERNSTRRFRVTGTEERRERG